MRGARFTVKAAAFVFLILFNILFSLYAREDPLAFEHITMAQGLSNSTIYCIFQDSRGFLWLGTNNGLNKYDGYNFKTYTYLPENSNSLSHNTVRTIIEDPSGVLWIGTFGGGLNKFDPQRETFTPYKSVPGDPTSLSNNNIFSVFADRTGVLWIGTHKGGLNRFSPGAGEFTHYQAVAGVANSLSDSTVREIYEDRSGILWIGTYRGLNKFDVETGTFTQYLPYPQDSTIMGINSVITILEDVDHEGILWIGTHGGGIKKFDVMAETFTDFPEAPVDPGIMSHSSVRKIYRDRSGILWIGGADALYRFDPRSGEFTRFLADSPHPGSPAVNIIRSIYEDEFGILWFGTDDRGLYKFNRKKKYFKHYYHIGNDDNSLSNNTVTASYEDRSGVFWIGTFKGLNKWNRENNTFTCYENEEEIPTSLSDDRVWSIYEDGSGEFWVGTLKGLNQFDRKTEKAVHYLADPKNSSSLSDNGIMSICEAQRDFLWVGTLNGLNRFHKKNKTFKRYFNVIDDPNSLSCNIIWSIFKDGQGVLWVGTQEGLNKYNPEQETFTRYLADPDNPNALSNHEITCFHEDSSGMLWLGTHGGLHKYDARSDTFSHYRVGHGLPGDLIYGILEDDGGNLWLSTNNGLSKFDPQQKEFKNYDASDGLQDNEFRSAYWKSKKGEMFFGGINGFNAFFPDRIEDNPHPPRVVITDFKVSNHSGSEDKEIEEPNIFEKYISEPTAEIELSPTDNTLSFEYVGLHYAAPESNQYAYKMEGLEKDWNNVGKRRFAVYPFLDPGHYEFQVKACNNDNMWSKTIASVKIYIPPPFWKCWWFSVLLGIVFLLMLFAGYYYRTQRLRKKIAEQERVQELLKKSRDEMKKSRDIAEFHSAESEKIIAAISSIFITVDAHGSISQWNEPAKEFFGIPGTKAKEQPFADVLKEYIPADLLTEMIEKGLNRDKASNNIEIQVEFKKEDQSKMLLANINPIIDKKGNNFGFILMAEDVTHVKKEQMQMLISQKLEALGQMAAGIAHEIRSPLQYIGDNVQFLMEAFAILLDSCTEIKDWVKGASAGEKVDVESLNRSLEENEFDFYINEIPASLDHIANGVARVSSIVKSMNEFSYSGKGISDKADLNEMLKTTLVVAHNRIKKVADLETDYAADLPPIYCGTGELNQVFLNLVLNAADAIAETGRHGKIKVSTKQQNNELIVEIADNGIGIPDEIKDKIFTPFFTTKKVGYGTGQGLPFSYSIVVERHKGKIYFESKVNQGTTFFIHLPVSKEILRSDKVIT